MTAPVHTLRVSNPFFEGKNSVYLILADPITLIDTGVATGRAFDVLKQGLAEHGVSVGQIERVILTHKHIDHIGNAWRIQQESGAEVLIHESETAAVSDVDPEGGRFAKLVQQRLEQWGVPAAETEKPEGDGWRWEIESAKVSPLVDGQQLDMGGTPMQVLHTPGHSVGCICLKYENHLFTGDHILPDISPNIGGGDLRHQGLLGDYMRSLNRVLALTREPLTAMPGHGEPFDGLEARGQELLRHHHERLEEIVDILGDYGEQTVYEIAGHLFGQMEDFHVVLGCAEAVAHLEYLADEGKVAANNGTYRLPAATA